MAEAVLSVVLQQLAVIVDCEMRKEIRLVGGVKKEVQKLTSTLEAIQAVLNDAEKRQVKEDAVRVWLDKLKIISYEIDDALDAWSTAILKSKIEGAKKAGILTKVSSYIFPPWLNSKQAFSHRQTAVKIKELTERLDVIASEKERYNFNLNRATEERERQNTTSFIDMSEVRGRQKDKENLLSRLLCDNNQQGGCPRVISIVGMGGIGKTTLAQLAYNVDEVEKHFQKRIWVCASEPFDEIRIAKAIVEALKGATPNVVELEALLCQIRESIKGKKFLLVLDDVWTEDYKKWEQLKHSLRYGAPESRILVTTRKETVAKVMETTHMICLGKLPSQHYWSLFRKAAFFGRSNEECKKLRDIGMKIADKCNGLPLAAKYLGNLMRLKRSREEWLEVLDSEIWELKETEGLFPPLLLSYYDLPSAMRRCFSYCAIFPKGYKISKDKLIKMWMAQGYLDSQKNLEMERIGQKYFDNLAMRSFFQDFEKDDNDGSIVKCKMHDIVHDFARYLMKNECLITEVDGAKELGLNSSCRKAYHSTLILAAQAQFPASIYNSENLHTLLVLAEPNSGITRAPSGLFLHQKYLRSLDLSGSSIEGFPMEVEKCVHLRYLNLSQNDHLKELAEGLCELCNLQTLDLHLCRGLKNLPEGMGKLINLRHLEIEGTYCLTMLPKGIGKLSSLRTLSKFIVSADADGDACKLGDLKNLNQLRGYLKIEGLGNVTNVAEAEKAEFKNKNHLYELILEFSSEKMEGRMDDAVIEALQPPPGIECLGIRNYTGTTMSPDWMTLLTSLRKLQIHHCMKCECLPPLGKLPSLESLDVGGMHSLRFVGLDILGIGHNQNGVGAQGQMSSVIAFPKLKKLRFWGMNEWLEWDGILRSREDVTVMPCIHSLELLDCPKLKALPDYLQKTPVEELKITQCPVLKQRYWGEGRNKISHIPTIEIDYAYVGHSGNTRNSAPIDCPNPIMSSRVFAGLDNLLYVLYEEDEEDEESIVQ